MLHTSDVRDSGDNVEEFTLLELAEVVSVVDQEVLGVVRSPLGPLVYSKGLMVGGLGEQSSGFLLHNRYS